MHPAPSRVHVGSVGKVVAIRVGTVVAALLAGRAQSQPVDPLSRNGGTDRSWNETGRAFERVPIFFPPNPPPLGRQVARGGDTTSRLTPPPELAAFVGEFFYPMLGTRLVTQSLNEKQRSQLEIYRETRLALRNELRGELAIARTKDAGAQAEQLAAFARRQTPRVAELERMAEQLRRDLANGDHNWSALRQWHLNDKPRRGYSPLEIAQVMRAFAFYQNGLLLTQRLLLREIAIELVFAAESTDAATAAQPYLFFAPEPARVTLPDDISGDVASRVAAYQTKKSALKKELFDAVTASDGSTLGFLRGSTLKSIAERQAASLAELDVLAEDIRRRLAATPPRFDPSPLPAALDDRVAMMVATYLGAQKDASARVETIIAAAKGLPLQATYRFEGDGLRFLVLPTQGRGRGGPGAPMSDKVLEVRAQISAVADDYGRRVAELINERDAIRREIARVLGITKAEEAERALLAATRRASQKQAEHLHVDYRTAVFEPGLSPEQRRLLFADVVERFELPLPRGDLQPVGRAETW